MKNIKRLLFIIICLSTFTLITTSCQRAKKKQVKEDVKYTCPMHPQIIEDHPGTCPICGMDLVKVNLQNDQKGLTLSESQMQLGNIKTITVGTGSFNDSKLLNAQLVTDPSKASVISSKFAGRIDHLYFQEAGQKINKGQALFQIYSEDLLALQKDYLLNIKQQEAFPEDAIYKKLTAASKNKLLLYGYTLKQIEKLRQSNATNPYITVYANEGGLITEINISEGQYIAEGMTLLRVENLNTLWVEAEIYPSEMGDVKLGQAVKINVTGYEDQVINSKIDFINPQLNAGSQILKIRASLPNAKGQFQPGMQANMRFPNISLNDAISLPNDAVIRNENGTYVWIKTGKDKFDFRKVEIGKENEQTVVIKNGILQGENVVISGAYLLTSEYILKKGGELKE